MTKTDRDLMSTQDLASFLQVPLATVYAWRHKRKGPPGILVGRYVRYRRSDVEAWLDESLQRGQVHDESSVLVGDGRKAVEGDQPT
jgi:excisionase family DNA binding protein